MNRLRPALVEQLPQTVLERHSPVINNHDQENDDDAFLTSATHTDHQANIRRRAPTRHSIKSLTGRKSLSKQNSTNEVKMILVFNSHCIRSYQLHR
jgi:hypothetical protein